MNAGSMGAMSRFLPAVVVLAACTPDTDSAPPVPDIPSRLFSFAVIADLHLGEQEDDHGDPGYDDQGGEGGAVRDMVALSIEAVNDSAAYYDIEFVLVLGDLTDSAERSEYEVARQLLGTLEMPWLPLIGNHDTWPYVRTDQAPGFDEADGPVGDEVFHQTFGAQVQSATQSFPDLALAPVPVFNPEHDLQSWFWNLSFTYQGWTILGLDLVTRSHAEEGYPGQSPEADLHDFDGGTWPWFQARLAAVGGQEEPHVLVFSHHPPVPLELDSFSSEEHATMAAMLDDGGYVGDVAAIFSGHWHFDYLNEDAYEDIPVVVTDASKESGAARVVQVFSDGSIDYDNLL